jgi:hypothetical protein
MEGVSFTELHAPSSTFQREMGPIKKRNHREQNSLHDEQGNIQNCGEFRGIFPNVIVTSIVYPFNYGELSRMRRGRMQNGKNAVFKVDRTCFRLKVLQEPLIILREGSLFDINFTLPSSLVFCRIAL